MKSKANSIGFSFCGGDSRMDQNAEFIDSKPSFLRSPKTLIHDGFLRIVRVAKSHNREYFRVLYAVEYPSKTLEDIITN